MSIKKTTRNGLILAILLLSCFAADTQVVQNSTNQTSTNNTQTTTPKVEGINTTQNKITEVTPAKPICVQDQLDSKSCSSCNRAQAIYLNSDCTKYNREIDDSSCSSLCPNPEPVYVAPAPTHTAPVDSCCKHCSTGKACGDSCISKSKTCHQAPGCACDY